MEKCHACGKTVFSPERFGKIRICRACYINVGGSLWNHRYHNLENLEKYRNLALESARSQSFPKSVLMAIDDFFTAQLPTINESEKAD